MGKGNGLTCKDFWYCLTDHGVQSTETDEHSTKALLDLYKHLTSRVSEKKPDLNHHIRELLSLDPFPYESRFTNPELSE